MSTDTVGSAVHLVSAGGLFQLGYGFMSAVAVYPHYCPDCMRAAIRWSAPL